MMNTEKNNKWKTMSLNNIIRIIFFLIIAITIVLVSLVEYNKKFNSNKIDYKYIKPFEPSITIQDINITAQE